MSKVKIIDKKSINSIKFEREILSRIKHPLIINLYYSFQDFDYLYLVLDFLPGGDLRYHISHHKRQYFNEEQTKFFIINLLIALKYIHSKKIIHRDIKLDNILVNFDSVEDKVNRNMLKSHIKIIDFGFARHLAPAQLAYSTLGSPINMDPGILRKLNKMEHSNEYGYDQKADIWSLGTICYEMLIGKCTFDAESMRELVSKVEKGNYYLPTTLSKEAVSFLNGMLQYDLKKRLSAEQLCNHKFLTKPYSELTKINLKEASQKIIGSQLQINSKKNQSIWVIFESEEEENLDNIPSKMVGMQND